MLEAGRKQLSMPVVGFIEDFVGLNAYMALPELLRRVGQPPTISGALLSVDRSQLAGDHRSPRELPALAAFSRPSSTAEGFEDEISNSFKALSAS